MFPTIYQRTNKAYALYVSSGKIVVVSLTHCGKVYEALVAVDLPDPAEGDVPGGVLDEDNVLQVPLLLVNLLID